MLLGRDREQQAIEAHLSRARAGESATLAFVGEPGIGKTALLEHAAERAAGMRLLHARGIESEAQIPFASLLELVRPALAALQRIPAPQMVALESALALRPGRAEERFAVGAATLSLLAAFAEEGPVAMLIDDAQWLDASSSQALLFALRRLVADPIAVIIAVREGEPSLLDGADLTALHLGGLSRAHAAALLGNPEPALTARLHAATGGNPLALLEVARDEQLLALAPEGAPVLVSSRIVEAFLRRVGSLDEAAQRALVLAATSDSGEVAMLERAASRLGVDLAGLVDAEAAGLVRLGAGRLEFRHPLARSATYARAPAEQRRAAHRALAAALPDRDVDRRAWHLAAAATGTDAAAAAALAQAGGRARARSAYATASAAFERAARLSTGSQRRAQLLLEAAEASWQAGLADRAVALLDEARANSVDPMARVAADHLAGHIATRRGPVMRGHAILTTGAAHAAPEEAAAMLAEAAQACFYAGDPVEMLAVARRARATLPEGASVQARFIAAVAAGMAEVFGGDAAAGAEALHEAVELADGAPELRENLQLLPWLAVVPVFLREAATGRSLLEDALVAARSRSALGALPFVLNLIARDQATSERWTIAEATYQEAIELASESDQRTGLQARHGREHEARASAARAQKLSGEVGTRLHEVWIVAALGELELGLGRAAEAAEQFERQRRLLADLGITDVDLWPGAELVDAYGRLGRAEEAERMAREFRDAAEAKGQPWSRARSLRCIGMVAPDAELEAPFAAALREHARTPDVFETARTRLAYGERLRRTRNRVKAREQLRAALEIFERLDARPWAERVRTELDASGETLRRRDSSSLDELTPQELRIAVLLAGGKTTREAAATLFLSPKTVEYHLRHVYLKLGVHSRDELAGALEIQAGASEKRPAAPAAGGYRRAPGALLEHAAASPPTL
jgi:DNA-binding CsgD family transcriptional regulator